LAFVKRRQQSSSHGPNLLPFGTEVTKKAEKTDEDDTVLTSHTVCVSRLGHSCWNASVHCSFPVNCVNQVRYCLARALINGSLSTTKIFLRGGRSVKAIIIIFD